MLRWVETGALIYRLSVDVIDMRRMVKHTVSKDLHTGISYCLVATLYSLVNILAKANRRAVCVDASVHRAGDSVRRALK